MKKTRQNSFFYKGKRIEVIGLPFLPLRVDYIVSRFRRYSKKMVISSPGAITLGPWQSFSDCPYQLSIAGQDVFHVLRAYEDGNYRIEIDTAMNSVWKKTQKRTILKKWGAGNVFLQPPTKIGLVIKTFEEGNEHDQPHFLSEVQHAPMIEKEEKVAVKHRSSLVAVRDRDVIFMFLDRIRSTSLVKLGKR